MGLHIKIPQKIKKMPYPLRGEIFTAGKNGASYDALAKQYKITAEEARIICLAEKESLAKREYWARLKKENSPIYKKIVARTRNREDKKTPEDRARRSKLKLYRRVLKRNTKKRADILAVVNSFKAKGHTVLAEQYLELHPLPALPIHPDEKRK